MLAVPGEHEPSTLVIMAAGSSTRFGSLKQLAPVGPGGETLLDFTVFDAIRVGVTRVILIVRSSILELVRSTVGDRLTDFVDVEYVLQDAPPEDLPTPPRSKPWGTAHAVLSAAASTDGNVAVVNADDYYGQETFENLARVVSAHNTDISIVAHRLDRTLSPNGAVTRGLCKVDRCGNLIDIEEFYHIVRNGSTVTGTNAGGGSVSLTGAEPACMNTWYFTRPALIKMRREWDSFLARPDIIESGAEFGLSSVVRELLLRGDIIANVGETPDECFGLTNPGDERLTREKLLQFREVGLYQVPLWGRPIKPDGNGLSGISLI